MDETFEDVLDKTEELLKAQFPHLSDESATRMAATMLGMSMLYAHEDREAIQVRTQVHLALLVVEKVEWAVKLNEEVEKSVSNSVEKAKKAGADPVEVMMANHGLTRTLAHSMLAVIRGRQ